MIQTARLYTKTYLFAKAIARLDLGKIPGDKIKGGWWGVNGNDRVNLLYMHEKKDPYPKFDKVTEIEKLLC